MQLTAAEAIVQIMVKEGILDAFGIPGAGINPVYKYLKDAPIKHYCMRHEEACTHAADGYFRASHKIALAICTSGPGATNFVTGLYTANIDSIPLLAIVGQANTHQLKQNPFQCVDMTDIAKSVCKKVYCPMKAEEIPQLMQEAFYLMRSGKPGPVVVELPLDVQNSTLDFDIADYIPTEITPASPDLREIKKAVQLIKESHSPIIIMGGGVILSEGETEVVSLAETLAIPIITTYMAKGGLPEAHPLNAGHMGLQVGQPLGNKIFLESDLVLGIGCRFSDRHTGDLETYCQGRKFIHIDIEPKQIGKVFPPHLAIISDAKSAATALLAEVKAQGLLPQNPTRASAIPKLRENLRRKTKYDSLPMLPHRVFYELNQAFDDDTMFTTGCGITQIWSGQLQTINKPRRYLPSGGAGTLGFEIPAAIGAKVADPSHHSVAVVGDFGFTYMGEEIAVASVLRQPIIVIIMNNARLGLIRQNQKGAYGFEYEVSLPCNQDGFIDYLKVAEGYGCLAERVFTPNELASALVRAKASGRCYVIDAVCRPEQLCDMGVSIASVKSWAPEE